MRTALTEDRRDELAELRFALARERADRAEAESALLVSRLSLDVAQRMEVYYRHLIEHAIDLITILERDGTIRFESISVTKELGWLPEEYRGRNAFEFVHSEDAESVREAFAQAVRTHGSTPLLTFRFQHKDGSYRILEGRGNNLLDDPAVRGIIFNSRDVTEQKKLEEQFHQAQKVQAIGQLTGGVAHDFNNILTVILGYSSLVLRQLAPGNPSYQNIDEIRRAAERAAGLTRQLLAFSRRQVLQPKVINIQNVLSDMDRMIRRLLGAHVSLVIISPPDLGNIKADQGQIEQVILNMAVNARDAMPEGGSLTLEARNLFLDDRFSSMQDGIDAGEYVLLIVSDTGAGMTPDVHAHLFEPFFTTKESGKGTGLGLATCHGIVKQSGGHIGVQSEPGKGAAFKIYLPRVFESVEIPPPKISDVAPLVGEETILLVEDEEMLRELGSTILEDLGYRIFTAENGRHALDLLRGGRLPSIDLVLTDLIMPEMSGQELVRHIRPLFPHTKIVYTSGYTEDSIIWSGGLEADVHFLPKPYSVATIAEKVREVLGHGATAKQG